MLSKNRQFLTKNTAYIGWHLCSATGLVIYRLHLFKCQLRRVSSGSLSEYLTDIRHYLARDQASVGDI